MDVIFPGGSFSFVVLSGDFQNYFNILLFRGLEARLYMHPICLIFGLSYNITVGKLFCPVV